MRFTMLHKRHDAHVSWTLIAKSLAPWTLLVESQASWTHLAEAQALWVSPHLALGT